MQLRSALAMVGQPARKLLLVGLARTLLVLLEESVEAVQIDLQPALLCQFSRQARWEAKGIKEPEDCLACQHCLAPLVQPLLQFLKLTQPSRQCPAKAFFLVHQFAQDSCLA